MKQGDNAQGDNARILQLNVRNQSSMEKTPCGHDIWLRRSLRRKSFRKISESTVTPLYIDQLLQARESRLRKF